MASMIYCESVRLFCFYACFAEWVAHAGPLRPYLGGLRAGPLVSVPAVWSPSLILSVLSGLSLLVSGREARSQGGKSFQ